MPNKIDSNETGLRIVEEQSLGVLLGTSGDIYYPAEPNSYSDFGGGISTVARNPINEGRQRRKGVVTDLEASGGFQMDLTQKNFLRLAQGYFYADWREKMTTASLWDTGITITAATTGPNTYTAAAGLDGFQVGELVFASGFTNSGNNGLKTVTAVAAATLTVSETLTAEGSPPAAAKLETVGFVCDSDDVDVSVVDNLPKLTSTTTDFTDLNLIPGEWVYIGGDTALSMFANAENNGLARVYSVTATELKFDKTEDTMVIEASSGGREIRIFLGHVLKNEATTALVTRRTFQLERTLGEDGVGVMSEYLVGAGCNEASINVPQADKVVVDVSFVATDNEQRTGTVGIKTGTRPAIVPETAFNTSSDFSRIKMGLVDAADSNVTPLFAYLSEMTLTIANNITPDKAVAVLGAFDVSTGTFEVGGSVTAYFADITAVQAVRNNSDVTIDFAMVKDNAGLLFDIPLLSLGNARLQVEQDQSIKLPLELGGAESANNHTLLLMEFAYLPTVAE